MKLIKISTVLIAVTVLFSCKNENKPKEENTTTSKQEIVNVKGEEVIYTSDSTNLKGYISFDENKKGKRPGVIIVHEWWGHNDYVRKRADMLAELGYTAIAIDMYGDGKQANHPSDAGKFAQSVMSSLKRREILILLKSLRMNGCQARSIRVHRQK